MKKHHTNTLNRANGPVTVSFLGGLGEIGRNCTCITVDGRILLVDFGLMFPDANMPGVDLVLPDFSFLRENKDSIEACVLTHGHEDHMGGLAFLLSELSFPIYGSKLAIGLAQSRIFEFGVEDNTSFHEVSDGERLNIGPFDVEFIPVTHSVPHGFAVCIRTPQGVIFHTGDFKIDLTPVDGRKTDLGRIGSIANSEKIRLLLSDSTNAEEPGSTESEKQVGKELTAIFSENRDSRIIVTCFASHLHRIEQIANASIESGRKIAIAGRSMINNMALARKLGLISVPEWAFIDIDTIGSFDPAKLCIISTGSQGEPMSALSLMASGEHKRVKVGPGDLVILSSHAIPGNEFNVNLVIDRLYRAGAKVIHGELSKVHVSGHARRDELAIMLSICKPEYFIPIHGEYRHLVNHALVAENIGMEHENILVCEDGDVVVLSDNGIQLSGEVGSNYLYVDGIVGDIAHPVLRDRQVLAQEGVIVIVVGIEAKTGEIITGPEIITKGWIDAQDSDELLEEAKILLGNALSDSSSIGSNDYAAVRRLLRTAMGKLVATKTKRKPMIVPVVMEI